MAIRQAIKTATKGSPARTASKSSGAKAAAKKGAAPTGAGKEAAVKKTAGLKAPAKKTAAKKLAAAAPAKKSAGRKYSPAASEQVGREMHEMHEGTLKMGRSGKKVTNPKQAIAIALSEARRAGKKVPPNPNTPKRK